MSKVAVDLNVRKNCIVKNRWQEKIRLQKPAKQVIEKIFNVKVDNDLVEHLHLFDTAVKAKKHFLGFVKTAQKQIKHSVLKSYAAAQQVCLSKKLQSCFCQIILPFIRHT